MDNSPLFGNVLSGPGKQAFVTVYSDAAGIPASGEHLEFPTSDEYADILIADEGPVWVDLVPADVIAVPA